MTAARPRPLIACVAYGGGHVNALVPVAKALMGGGCQVLALGLTTAGAVLEREGIPRIGFRDLVRPGDERAIGIGTRLAESFPPGPVPREETIAYLGLSYADLEARLGVDAAAAAYAKLGRQAFMPNATLERWLRELAPDLVIATNSPRAERAAIEAARVVGIPAVCIVDLFALQEVAWIGRPGFADRVCVLSQAVKDLLVAAGRQLDEVVVTGNPVFDRLGSPELAARARQLRLGKGWGQDWVVLWASQPEPEIHPFTGARGDPELPRRAEAALMEAVASHPTWRLVVRRHPSEPQLDADPAPRIHHSPRSEDLPVLLRAVDAVVTMTSTVGLEAALVGRPVVSLRMSVFDADAPYADMGIALGARTLGDLEPCLVRVLERGDWHPRVGGPAVGGATAAVVAVARALLDPSHPIVHPRQ